MDDDRIAVLRMTLQLNLGTSASDIGKCITQHQVKVFAVKVRSRARSGVAVRRGAVAGRRPTARRRCRGGGARRARGCVHSCAGSLRAAPSSLRLGLALLPGSTQQSIILVQSMFNFFVQLCVHSKIIGSKHNSRLMKTVHRYVATALL